MTARGWAILGLALGLLIAGRLLGLGELIQVAVALDILCLAAIAWVRAGQRRLEASFHLSSSWVHRGNDLEVAVWMRNPDPLPTPVLVAGLDLPRGMGSFNVPVSPIEPRRERHLSLSVRPGRRGRFEIGPLKITLSDPFGISHRSREYGERSVLVVYPRIEHLAAPDKTSSRTAGDRPRRAPTLAGEDFFGVREYQTGDDPRKVHWRSTARLGTLMVREDEAGGGERTTIFLDDRDGAYSGSDGFEHAVEAAASVVALYARFGSPIRLTRAGGEEVEFGRGSPHYNRILENLAVATPEPVRQERFRTLLRGGLGGSLVVVSGALGPWETTSLARAAAVYRDVIVVMLPGPPPSEGTADPTSTLRAAGATTVMAPMGPDSERLAEAWAASMRRSVWNTYVFP